jgi:hypothetical protein
MGAIGTTAIPRKRTSQSPFSTAKAVALAAALLGESRLDRGIRKPARKHLGSDSRRAGNKCEARSGVFRSGRHVRLFGLVAKVLYRVSPAHYPFILALLRPRLPRPRRLAARGRGAVRSRGPGGVRLYGSAALHPDGQGLGGGER